MTNPGFRYAFNQLLACVRAGGYKGYGHAMMVEMFCGTLADEHFGLNVRVRKNADCNADILRLIITL